ncbi:bifunctional transcriptional activator/DNA repair enzyme AdaA [Acidicapsa dinghuensis]|uniref:Bifunctional transcriptional activator/DNA repair enzyme AdaA n=1 Tax=Acidicapsa dinghuensis TaxID=2218256 RepID=A0ABW1EF99_9BACT|nr:methylated-DNA--[protein]-cysteine S-methyltransferase [Acidicapsa dinghuensis]
MTMTSKFNSAEAVIRNRPLGSTHTSHIDEDTAWKQLLDRDGRGEFFYAVTTTGVFCRPDCKSRTPLRTNVRFFATQEQARTAGYRACMRCKPEAPRQASPVARMCAYLEREIDRPVRLETLGRLVGMSPFSVQRIFKKAMGVSPAEYQRAMRAHGLRSQLREGGTDVTTAIYEAGYGSASRAYETQPLGMTPGRFLAGGRGEKIGFATGETTQTGVPGWVIVAATQRGICWLALADTCEAAEASLRDEFPAAEIVANPKLGDMVETVLKRMQGEKQAVDLPLDLRGTAFQLRVWKVLQEIPEGVTKTYGQLAAEMGMPKSTRAVARACATNRVSVLVPCHRVVGASGSLTGYRWGVERKRELLKKEGARLA